VDGASIHKGGIAVAEFDTLAAIRDTIDKRESFVVEAGAGSGKTRSLIETVQTLIDMSRVAFERTNKRVVCITYTNVAKDEIITRLNGDPLVLVGTIHEFLWQVISQFQREMRIEILTLNKNAKKSVEDLEQILQSTKIIYGKFGRHFDRGELFHDDVIAIAGVLFEKYPKISRIAVDQFPFIFVDEYQDTSQVVVDLLLKYFVKNQRKPVVGFFGDSMQQIYDSNITDVAAQNGLRLIAKPENYRCSVAVIEVLNRLRTDLQQVPSGENKPGSVRLLTSSGSAGGAYMAAMEQLDQDGWTLDNTKILMLTHRGIAREIGFGDLLAAYNLRSFGNEILMERTDEFGELFTFVHDLVNTYTSKRYGEFLQVLGTSGHSLVSRADKTKMANEMNAVIEIIATGTVSDVIRTVASSSMIFLPRRLARLQEKLELDSSTDSGSFAKQRSFAAAVLEVPWVQVDKFLDYADEHTPFSTKHGVKGAEFENVLVIIDDSLWNRYKFAQVFTNDNSNPSRLERSRNLLYVCFSRSKNGLAVLYLGSPSTKELSGARGLLGVDKIVTLD
jgi:DNA helicase II / ATP-dependent DNA helicase PcrA